MQQAGRSLCGWPPGGGLPSSARGLLPPGALGRPSRDRPTPRTPCAVTLGSPSSPFSHRFSHSHATDSLTQPLFSPFFFNRLFMRFRGGGGGAGPRLACAPGLPRQLPLFPRHAALCRLALPNFCLKLNLKEKKIKTQNETDKESRISVLGDFSGSARGEGGARVGGEGRTAEPLSPSSRSWERHRGTDLDPEPAARSLVSAETRPQTDAA